MAALNTTRQNGVLLVALLFAQLLLMSGSVREAHSSARFESVIMRVTSPVVGLAQWVGGWVSDSLTGARELWDAHTRSAAMEQEIGRLRTQLSAHREATFENERLRTLLGMRDNLAPESLGASVVTSVLTEQTKMIVVDRGSADGVRPDLPVVAWGGAVGRVIAVDAGHAKVRLLSDPNSGVAGVVQRSRAQGMVFGQGELLLDLRYVPRFSDVAHGDRVVTSGLDGIFPAGFGIGRVDSVAENPDGTQTIRLMPLVDFGSLQEILILPESRGGEWLTAPAEVAGDVGEEP